MSSSWSRFTAGVLLSVLLSPAAVLAHHPVLAKFDNDRPLILAGVVTSVDWNNPHVHVYVNLAGEEGGARNWAVELESPVVLERAGWTRDTLAFGDAIEVEGLGARDGSDQLWGETVMRGGERLFVLEPDAAQAALDGRPEGQAPRWPDGQPRLGPAPGRSGYWTAPDRSGLVEEGVDVAMDAHGLLRHLYEAPQVAPLQDWARDLYVQRQRDYLEDDPGYLYCMPPGGPRHFQMPFPYGIQFVEDRERERIFVLTGGGNSNWRLIYLGGPDQPGRVHVNENDPLFYGVSDGHWEGDTLVVETTGFNEGFWFSNGGLPHTRHLRLVERISRPDLNTLNYEVTIDDSGAYTRPWTSSWTLQWLPGEDVPEHFCQGNRP